ncbi:MAG: FG-GAP-like repeat-containing protein [Candidatus Cloacimonadales bacterium]|nr:FG-GAP-like repeat-containing protein [Candidatus Cloacimonadales bacterium]
MNDKLNTKKLVIFAFCLLLFTFLSAQNSMEQLAYLEGEQGQDWFGSYIETLDFNGDGRDDLAVSAPGYNVNETTEGRLYIYFGKEENFADSADIVVNATIEEDPTFSRTFSMMKCLGDINNDGYDDLAYRVYSVFFNLPNNPALYELEILLGNNTCDTIPDFVYEFHSDIYSNMGFLVNSLGDINNDGYDDIGFCNDLSDNNPRSAQYFIIYGGSYELVDFGIYEIWNRNAIINGIGDINNDGYDDFTVFNKQDNNYHNSIYFGATEIDTIPDIDLNDYISQEEWPFSGLYRCGDWNNDGIDDFMSNEPCNNGIGIWFGGDGVFDPNADFFIEFYAWAYSNSFGDFNSDGKDDLAMGYKQFNRVYNYLGNQNGTCDLILSEGALFNFGKDVAIGDYSCDGFDDLAVGSNQNEVGWPGRFWVFAGNGDLEEADPNIAVEEDVVSNTDIVFNAYPNPFNPTVTFEIKAEGYVNLQIDIFNVKGQKVETISPILCHPEHVEGRGETITWNAENQASGVYFSKLLNAENKTLLAVEKITLLK